jgi:hypothetical protein
MEEDLARLASAVAVGGELDAYASYEGETARTA